MGVAGQPYRLPPRWGRRPHHRGDAPWGIGGLSGERGGQRLATRVPNAANLACRCPPSLCVLKETKRRAPSPHPSVSSKTAGDFWRPAATKSTSWNRRLRASSLTAVRTRPSGGAERSCRGPAVVALRTGGGRVFLTVRVAARAALDSAIPQRWPGPSGVLERLVQLAGGEIGRGERGVGEPCLLVGPLAFAAPGRAGPYRRSSSWSVACSGPRGRRCRRPTRAPAS
jgi:hypothetical protein